MENPAGLGLGRGGWAGAARRRGQADPSPRGHTIQPGARTTLPAPAACPAAPGTLRHPRRNPHG